MKCVVLYIVLLCTKGVAAAQHQVETNPINSAQRNAKSTAMLRSVHAFLQTLKADQQKKATYPFTDEERYNWYYVPRERKGLPIKEMNEAQRKAALAILRTAMSDQGYTKAKAILDLEVVLKQLEGRGPGDNYRDPEKYYFTIFGAPSDTEPWGWRVEGHHLSLNFSSLSGEVTSATPAFMGSNPAIVPSGPQNGKQILKQEAELGFALLHSFSADQLRKVVINEVAPNDIVTSNNRKAMLEHPEGIHFAEMTAAQQKLFRQLLDVYLQNYQSEIANDLMGKVEQAGFDQLHFAWAGSQQPGEGRAHYYRIHGPVILIEYDNSQNNANHVHTVIRDLTNDFGEDALRKHYQFHKHGN